MAMIPKNRRFTNILISRTKNENLIAALIAGCSLFRRLLLTLLLRIRTSRIRCCFGLGTGSKSQEGQEAKKAKKAAASASASAAS